MTFDPHENFPPETILLVDDDETLLGILKRWLVHSGYLVETVTGGMQAIQRLQDQTFDLVIIDLKLPDLDGLQLLTIIRAIQPETQVIILSGQGTMDDAIKALREGRSFDFLRKPLSHLRELNLMVGLDAPQRDRRWILHNSLPLAREGETRPYAVVTSMTDVTARIQAEDRLKRSLDELECANAQLRNSDRYKDQFLSSVSHELRGPLSLISGFGSMLSEEPAGPLSDAQREYVWGVMDAAENLTALVNDLLDLGALQAGRFTIHPHVFCFEELLASVAIKHGILAEAKGQTLTFDAPPDLPELYADAQRLRQILSNLLTNALKYTPEGGRIHIRAWQDSDTLRCEVTDTGIGISEWRQPPRLRATVVVARCLSSRRGR